MATNRQPVQAQDIEVGCILFLPRESFTSPLKCMWSDVSGHPCHEHGNCVLKKEGHHHPVVIIGKHYGLNEKKPGALTVSFVQMTHGEPRSATTSGASAFSPYGHYQRSTGGLPFPENYRSRYWFRGLEFLERGPGNFRYPHVFFTESDNLKTMSKGVHARAYDSRLDEGSYLRVMQRLNLQPKTYIPDDYWNGPPSPPRDGSDNQEQMPPSPVSDIGSKGESSNEPRGHHTKNRGKMRSHIQSHPAVPILDPAPCGRCSHIASPLLSMPMSVTSENENDLSLHLDESEAPSMEYDNDLSMAFEESDEQSTE